MFKTLLASLGVGAAKVDLVLDQNQITMGEKVTGQVRLTGGEVKQTIQGLSVDFRLWSVIGEGFQVKEKVCTISATDETFELQPGEERTYPFFLHLPAGIPPLFLYAEEGCLGQSRQSPGNEHKILF